MPIWIHGSIFDKIQTRKKALEVIEGLKSGEAYEIEGIWLWLIADNGGLSITYLDQGIPQFDGFYCLL